MNDLLTLSDIVDSATTTPIIDSDDLDSDTKNGTDLSVIPPVTNNANVLINHQIIDANNHQNNKDNEPPDILNQPRRSSRISTKTADKSKGIVKSSRLEEIIRQSKESAHRKSVE